MQIAVAVAALVWSGGARADLDRGSAYIYVSKQIPEHLYLIDGGRVVFESPVNTGISAAPTPEGVFRIFASYPQKTMKGTDPVTLRRYTDANVPYVMYFDGGRAIHGFYRRGYGHPQSLGCVELPVHKARELYERLRGGLATEVVVAQRPPFGRARAGSSPGLLRPVGLASRGPDVRYSGEAAVAAGLIPLPYAARVSVENW